MKRQIITAVVLVLGAVAFISFKPSQAQEQTKPCEGKVGDVKYSVLDFDKFTKLNGKEWVEMDGRSAENSDLALSEPLIKIIPDARGVFVRGMNGNRDENTGDVDKNRAVGQLQLDSFQGHKHISNPNIALYYNKRANDNQEKRHVVTGDVATNSEGKFEAGFGTPRISKETRPRNIALYTYIKINKCQGEN